jgi:hypothetical protein
MCTFKAFNRLAVLLCGLTLPLPGDKLEAGAVMDPASQICWDLDAADRLEETAARCRQRGYPEDCPGVAIDWENRVVSPDEADAYAVRQRQDVNNLATWVGNWSPNEMKTASCALAQFQDTRFKDWIIAHIQLDRYTEDDSNSIPNSPVSADGSALKFRGVFFTDTTDARRENLLAFEGGRAFWSVVTENGSNTIGSWWWTYHQAHTSAIFNMKATKFNGESLSGLSDNDPMGMMAYVFRAEALQLEKPHNRAERNEWESVVSEFENHVRQAF